MLSWLQRHRSCYQGEGGEMKITNNEIIVEFPEEEIATIHTYHWVSGFNNAIDKTERLNPPMSNNVLIIIHCLDL